jgi:Mg-chelatase subunit ChlD
MLHLQALKLDKTAAAMRLHYDCPAEDRKLTCEPLFDANKQPAHAFHFVFCLDASGSMAGRWVAAAGSLAAVVTAAFASSCSG